MDILELTHETDEYETYIKHCQRALFYYSLSYKKFLESLLGCQAHYLIAKEQGRICGILPLMVVEGRFGKIVNSLPFYGSNGGALYDNSKTFISLSTAYLSFLEENHIAAATLISNPLSTLNLEESEAKLYDFQDHRIGQWTPLKDKNALIESLDSSARRNIRKAQKEGIIVEVENHAVEFLKDVHQENMKSIGGLAKTEKFFSLFPSYFTADAEYKIYMAKKGGKRVAALLVFYYNRVVEYFTPVILEEHRSDQPLALLIFHAMQEAMDLGYQWWNWGGTWLTQDSVYKFKKKWGSIDKPYTYYTKVSNKEILKQTKETLLAEYPHFFVVPFNQLAGVRSEH